MQAPAFWWLAQPVPLARMLAPAGAIYGAVTALRMALAGRAAARPVVCVGNFTAGGAGKTPAAIALAHLLRDLGHAPVFLSRGYGGALRGPPRRVDRRADTAALVGDEPLLLAREAPAIVSADRFAGAARCVEAGASVIVMDDGLQNPSLQKTLRIAVVDGARGAGNGLCLPAGPLRAPLERQLKHVDLVVVVGAGGAGERIAARATARGLPCLTARLEPAPAAIALLRGRKVHAFAGIGHPEKFFESLEACGAILAGRRAFPDHHAYSGAELASIRATAKESDALPVTTEKDIVRIEDAIGIATLPVTLVFDDPVGLRTLLESRIGPPRA